MSPGDSTRLLVSSLTGDLKINARGRNLFFIAEATWDRLFGEIRSDLTLAFVNSIAVSDGFFIGRTFYGLLTPGFWLFG